MAKQDLPVADFIMWLYDLATKYPAQGQSHRQRLRDIAEFYELLVKREKTQAELEKLKADLVLEEKKLREAKVELVILKAIKGSKLYRG